MVQPPARLREEVGAAVPESALVLVDDRQRSDDASGPQCHWLGGGGILLVTVWGWL